MEAHHTIPKSIVAEEPLTDDPENQISHKSVLSATKDTAKLDYNPVLEHKSLYLFSGSFPPRLFVYNFVRHKVFETFVIISILANCVTLAMDDPTADAAPPEFQIMEMIFTVIFTTEMILKVFSLGLVGHEGAYLRNSWNCLDFFIVCLSYLSFLPGFGNYTAIRTLRVLRPLRSMNALPALKVIINGIFLSVKSLVNVVALAAFLFLVCGILGVQLWSGILVNRCFDPVTNTFPDTLRFCTPGGENCPDEQLCTFFGNPNFGYTNFDHIGWVFLVLFQCVTMEGWPGIMYMIFDTWGVLAAFYFIFIVVAGSYVVLNLVLAVISFEFSQIRQQEKCKALQDVLNHAHTKEVKPSSVVNVFKKMSQPASNWTKACEFVEGSNTCQLLLQALAKVRRTMRVIVEGEIRDDSEESVTTFNMLIIFCIFVNTAVLAGEHHGQSETLSTIFEQANYILTGIFAFEMFFKLIALGIEDYARDRFNLLDGTVVVISLIELNLSGSSTASAFRGLRLLRLLKLLKSFPSLRSLIQVIMAALAETGYLNIIVLLYLFIASLMGMSFFGGQFRKLEAESGPIRSTFDSFYWSFLTIFQIMTREGWVDVMWNAMRATTPAASIFFIVLVLVGDFLLLNLFLAILIEAFEEHGSTDTGDELRASINEIGAELNETEAHQIHSLTMMEIPQNSRKSILPKSIGAPRTPRKSIGTPRKSIGSPRKSIWPQSHFLEPKEAKKSLGGPLSQTAAVSEICPLCSENVISTVPPAPGKKSDPRAAHQRCCERAQIRKSRAASIQSLLESLPMGPVPSSIKTLEYVGQAWEIGAVLNYSLSELGLNDASLLKLSEALTKEAAVLRLRVGEERIGGSVQCAVRESAPKKFVTNGGVSCFLFGPENRFRILLSACVAHPWFDRIILLFIVISSLLLALDDPREKITRKAPHIFEVIDNIFTALFVTEMILKIISMGLVLHPGAYLRDPWNNMDCVIVILSVSSLFVSGSSLNTLKVFRSFRTLRPLRVVNKNRGLKMVVTTLFHSIKGITSVALVIFIVFLIFGILGVQMLNGKLYYCNDESVTRRLECEGFFVQDTGSGKYRKRVMPRIWTPHNRNFDNIYNAVLTLFEMATLEYWNVVMYNAVDAVDKDTGPIRDYNPLIGLYFVLFIVVGSFFMMNLFVGVIIFSFNSVKAQMDGLSLLTADQKLWVEAQQLMLNFRPSLKLLPRSSTLEKLCFRVVMSTRFEMGIGFVILCNVMVLGLAHENASASFEKIMFILNTTFAGVFICEAILKMIALNYKYFWEAWNRFDCFLVMLSIVEIVLENSTDVGLPISPGTLRVFRVFRVLRIVRLIKQAKQVRILIETLWYSLPALGNILAFQLLLLFIYAVLGVQLFGLVQESEFINRNANFWNFPQAMLMLVRVTTGEDWKSVMHSCMAQPPYCPPEYDPDTDQTYDTCGSSIIAPVYFISFLLISAYVLTNLFVAIILDNFNTTMKIEKSSLSMQDLHLFVEHWSQWDPNATLVISTQRLPGLLSHMPPPVGRARVFNRMEILVETQRYCIPEHGGSIHFAETLIPLARRVLGIQLEEKEMREQEHGWKVAFPDVAVLPVVRFGLKRITVDQYFAACYIQSAFKRKRAIRLVNKLRKERYSAMVDWCLLQEVEAPTPRARPSSWNPGFARGSHIPGAITIPGTPLALTSPRNGRRRTRKIVRENTNPATLAQLREEEKSSPPLTNTGVGFDFVLPARILSRRKLKNPLDPPTNTLPPENAEV